MLKKIIPTLFLFLLIFTFCIICINIYVVNSSSLKIKNTPENADCILILGCGLRADGTPSKMLADRLKTGIQLYKGGRAPKIIMSGDHGQKEYDEVNAMKDFALNSGIPSEDIFMDHAGFSTYESLYRAKEIFKAEKVIVVTQAYHLYRAVFCGEKMGLDIQGIKADLVEYPGHRARELREIIARVKDFCYCIFMPEPTYLGEVIPVTGNGNITNDK